MPKSVKAFVALGVLYVLFGGALLAWFLAVTVPEQAQFFATLPAAVRAGVHNDFVNSEIRDFTTHTVIFVALAGLIAIWRQRWARWALAIYFVLVFVDPLPTDILLYLTLPKGFPLPYGGVEGWWQNYVQSHFPPLLQAWPIYLGTAFKLALIILIFSPSARPWFRRERPE